MIQYAFMIIFVSAIIGITIAIFRVSRSSRSSSRTSAR